MNNTIIIYGSQYGSTKRYAEHLSEMTGIKAIAFKEAKDIISMKELSSWVLFMRGVSWG